MARLGLLVGDLSLSFMWVWAGTLTKLFVYNIMGMAHQPEGEALKISLSVLYMFFFAWLGNLTNGAAYNPLTVLSSAFSGGIGTFFFTAFGRIPVQVIGSVIGVKSVVGAFPELGHGPRLNVEIHHGALTEGMLTFMIVMVSMGLKKKGTKSFFMKTWISSVSKVSLNILGSDLTGGIMNPASAFGWAYARGDHITWEHLFVYWVAPIQATLLAVLVFWLFAEPTKSKEEQSENKKSKTE